MTTKTEIIAALKLQYLTLKTGDDEAGYTDLEPADYEAKLSEWADSVLAVEAEAKQVAAEVTAKEALLKRLGITAAEAELLLN